MTKIFQRGWNHQPGFFWGVRLHTTIETNPKKTTLLNQALPDEDQKVQGKQRIRDAEEVNNPLTFDVSHELGRVKGLQL